MVDATKDVQLSGEEFVLSSLVTSETDLLYVLHLMDLTGEDWLKDVEAPEERDVKRQNASQQKL